MVVMRKQIFDQTLLKFLVVGVCNTLVGCGIMFLLYNFAGCSYWQSSAANYIVGGFVSFMLNKYFTFQSKAWSWRQVWRFIINLLVCYLLAYGLAKPIVRSVLAGQSFKWQENMAMLTGMCLYTGLNYLGQRWFAFYEGKHK